MNTSTSRIFAKIPCWIYNKGPQIPTAEHKYVVACLHIERVEKRAFRIPRDFSQFQIVENFDFFKESK